MFVVLSLPRARSFRLVCVTSNGFEAGIAYANAGPSALLLAVSNTGFRVLRSRRVGSSVIRGDAFRMALRRALIRQPTSSNPGLPPPGTKQRQRDCR
jgi:hypothetical protein